MIIDGLILMVLGMAIVYIFLIILMFFIHISSKLFKVKVMSAQASNFKANTNSDNVLISVLSSAISTYRNKKKGIK